MRVWQVETPRRIVRSFLIAALSAAALAGPALGQDLPVEGAWRAQQYLLAGGAVHELRGHILFAGGDWNVLFFVLDDDGEPRRMSAEGGSYTLDGDDLVFTHLYLAAKGDAVEGLPEAPFRMVARDGDGPEEPTTVTIEGSLLTLHFPSGNRMTFTKTQG